MYTKKYKLNLQNIEHLPGGIVVFKKLLSVPEQEKLVKDSFYIASQGDNESLLPRKKVEVTSNKAAIPFFFYNWPTRPESYKLKKPKALLYVGKKLFKVAYTRQQAILDKLDNEIYHVPKDFNPISMYAIMYPYEGTFPLHVDGARKWTCSLNVGETAIFYYRTLDFETHEVRLESGDAILFNGGQIRHGVKEILENSAPKFWYSNSNCLSVFGLARLNIQFRDPVNDYLNYRPHFYDNNWNLNVK